MCIYNICCPFLRTGAYVYGQCFERVHEMEFFSDELGVLLFSMILMSWDETTLQFSSCVMNCWMSSVSSVCWQSIAYAKLMSAWLMQSKDQLSKLWLQLAETASANVSNSTQITACFITLYKLIWSQPLFQYFCFGRDGLLFFYSNSLFSSFFISKN